MAEHRLLVDADLHKPGYVQATDPGPTGPGRLWCDTSAGTGAWVIKIRNNADSGWENLGVIVPAMYLTSLFLWNPDAGGGAGAYQEYKCRNNVDGDPEFYAV